MWNETVEQTSGGAQTMSNHEQIQTAVQTDGIYKVQGRRRMTNTRDLTFCHTCHLC